MSGDGKESFYKDAQRAFAAGDSPPPLPGGLEDEIGLLRMSIRTMVKLSYELGDPEKTIRALNAVGLTATRLAGLLRTQLLIDESQGNDTNQAIVEAIRNVIKEKMQT